MKKNAYASNKSNTHDVLMRGKTDSLYGDDNSESEYDEKT